MTAPQTATQVQQAAREWAGAVESRLSFEAFNESALGGLAAYFQEQLKTSRESLRRELEACLAPDAPIALGCVAGWISEAE